MISRIKKYFCSHNFYLYELKLGSDIFVNQYKYFYKKCEKCGILDTKDCFYKFNEDFLNLYKPQGGIK